MVTLPSAWIVTSSCELFAPTTLITPAVAVRVLAFHTTGVGVLIVLKDIWGLDSRKTRSVAQWAAGALVRAAVAESIGEGGDDGSSVVVK